MKESSTYQAILAEEARKVLRIQGDDAFGPPDTATAAAIEQMEDVTQLEALLKRMRTATSWQELLSQPAPRRRGGRRPSS